MFRSNVVQFKACTIYLRVNSVRYICESNHSEYNLSNSAGYIVRNQYVKLKKENMFRFEKI